MHPVPATSAPESRSRRKTAPTGSDASDGATSDNASLDSPTHTKEPIKAGAVIAALVSSWGGLIFGYDIGGSGGTFTMVGFREQMGWPAKPPQGTSEPSWVTDQQGWITSVFALGAVAGALASGSTADRIGRKWAIILFAAIFTVAAIIMGACGTVELLYVGRFIGGIGVGGLSMASTCYMSEIAPERIRGLLVALQQLCITFGIFLAACLNVGLQHWTQGWRFSYCGNGFVAVLLMATMFFCPESPRWLYKKGRTDDARATLVRIRQAHEVDPELAQIVEDERIAVLAAQTKWSDLFRHANNMRYRTNIGVAILFLQQMTGINAIMYFAPVIFADFLSTNIALMANLLLMFLNFVSTFITIAYVDTYGRRTLLVWGSFGMAITSAVVCLLSSKLFDYNNDTTVAWLIVAFCALYVINFAFSWGPVGWIVPAEIFPLDLRGKGMTLSTTANWLCNFAIGRVTPEFLRKDVFDLWGTFLFFGACCFAMGFFTLLFVPETKSVTLEQIDGVVQGFRSMSFFKRLTTVRLHYTSKEAEAFKSAAVRDIAAQKGIEIPRATHGATAPDHTAPAV